MRNIHRYPQALRSDFQIDFPLMNFFLCGQKRSLKVTRECTKVAYQAVAASFFLYYPKVRVKAFIKILMPIFGHTCQIQTNYLSILFILIQCLPNKY